MPRIDITSGVNDLNSKQKIKVSSRLPARTVVFELRGHRVAHGRSAPSPPALRHAIENALGQEIEVLAAGTASLKLRGSMNYPIARKQMVGMIVGAGGVVMRVIEHGRAIKTTRVVSHSGLLHISHALPTTYHLKPVARRWKGTLKVEDLGDYKVRPDISAEEISQKKMSPVLSEIEENYQAFISETEKLQEFANEHGVAFAVYSNGRRVGEIHSEYRQARNLAYQVFRENPTAEVAIQQYPNEEIVSLPGIVVEEPEEADAVAQA